MSPKKQEKYNRKEGECCWPTTIGSNKCKPCDFSRVTYQPETIDELKLFGDVDINKLNSVLGKYNLVFSILRKGAIIGHSTLSPKNSWWNTQTYPKGNMVWFTVSKKHQKNIPKTHTLYYKVNKNILCFYERNIWEKYGVNTGQEYYDRVYNRIHREVLQCGLNINGYIGCNECEIGLTDLSNILTLEHIEKHILKFID